MSSEIANRWFACETIWLSQANIAEFYQTTKQNVSLDLKNLYEEGKLVENRVVKEYLTTGPDGKNDVSVIGCGGAFSSLMSLNCQARLVLGATD